MAPAFKEKTGLGAWDAGVERLWSGITGLPTGGGSEASVWNLYKLVPTPEEMAGIYQSKGRLDEFSKQSSMLQQEVLRQSVSLDPLGQTPAFGQVPEQ